MPGVVDVSRTFHRELGEDKTTKSYYVIAFDLHGEPICDAEADTVTKAICVAWLIWMTNK
jgi:hypothetical protein